MNSNQHWLERAGLATFAPAGMDLRAYIAAVVGLLWMVLLAALAA